MKILPWAILLVAVVWGYGCHRERVGELNGRIASLENLKVQVDTVYRTDTLTLTKVRRRTDSVLVTDTLFHVDTVKVLIAAERQACDAALSTCESRVAVRDSIITVLKRKPSVWSKLPWVAAGVLGGILLK